ncbi:CubicO group peptidase (beta-lactamase class C family) [Bosea sp. OAE506]|uniref:serine hydrolase domain-containing protein n=1 Tax=Bosea sp. OAE506 TaxID=2663870 RepID=UPI00178A5A2E
MNASFDSPGIISAAAPSRPTCPRSRPKQVRADAGSIVPLPGADRFGIEGEVTRTFEPVAQAFIDNFEREGEVGAALCVICGGVTVVDVWGGIADPQAGTPWRRETRAPLFSTGKGAIAAACVMAVSRGLFAYDDPLSHSWPAFGCLGKERITFRQILDHSAGLALFGQHMDAATLDDPEATARIIEQMEPVWAPGERWGYHLATFGTVLSQAFRQADPTGRSVESFFAEEIAAPLSLDITFGLAEGDDCAAPALPGMRQMTDLMMRGRFGLQAQMLNPLSLLHRTLREVGLRLEDRSWLRHALPSGNAVGSARAVARLYAALQSGIGLGLDPVMTAGLAGPVCEPPLGCRDEVMGVANRWGLGFVRPSIDFPFSPSRQAFGMPGLGGSFGFADPQRRLAYAYVPNRLGILPFDDRRDARIRQALDGVLAEYEPAKGS